MKRSARHRNMSGIFFFIHTKKNYFRSNVSEEESRMKNIYLAYFLIIILSACGGKSSDTASLSGEIKGWEMTPYIYMVQTKCTTAWIPCSLRMINSRQRSLRIL